MRIAEADRRLDQGGRLSTGVKDFFQGFCMSGGFPGVFRAVARGISGDQGTELKGEIES